MHLGQGSDEIFGGYDVYLRDFLREPDLACPDNNLNESTRLQKLQECTTAMANGSVTTKTGHGNKISSHLSSEIPSFAYVMSAPHLFPSPWVIQQFGRLSPQVSLIENMDVRARDLMRTKWHPLHAAQYVWNKTLLPNMLLTNLSDRTEMSHSVEGRVPFLDHHLIEYVNGLPPSMKIRYDPETGVKTEKWILRQASRPFITDELYTRTKHVSPCLPPLAKPLPYVASTDDTSSLKPYKAPTTYPLDGPMHRLMSRLITQSSVEKLGFIDWEKSKDLVETAFQSLDRVAMTTVFGLAQLVVLGQRFGMPRAER